MHSKEDGTAAYGGNDMMSDMDENDLIISPAKFAYPKNSYN